MLKNILKYLQRTPKRKNSLDIKKRRKITLNNKIFSKFKRRKNQLSLNFNILNKLKFLWNNAFNYYIVICLLIIVSILFIIFWPIFKIKIVNIIKKDDITNINIAYNSIESFRWKHILFIDKSEIIKKLTTYQQNIKNININIILPYTLKILVESYKWVFYTTLNNKNYLITENWTLIALKNDIKKNKNILKNIKIVTDIKNNHFLDYKKVFNENIITLIDNSIKKLEKNIINLQIKDIIYYDIEKELHIKLKNNTILIYSLNQEINNQIEKTAIFNKDFLQINKSDIIYIDLRIKNKIFYCLKETETDCKSNIKRIYK